MSARGSTNTAAERTSCSARRVIFSNFVDQRLYRVDGDGEPRADHAEPATSGRRSLRRWTRDTRRPAPDLRSRAASRRRRVKRSTSWWRCRRTAPTRRERSSRATIFIRPRGSAPMGAAGLAGLEPPEHAVGWHRALGGRAGRRWLARESATRRRRRGNRSSSPSGRPTVCCTSCRIAAAGGTCIGRAGRWSRCTDGGRVWGRSGSSG